jgi:hypothetical protein
MVELYIDSCCQCEFLVKNQVTRCKHVAANFYITFDGAVAYCNSHDYVVGLSASRITLSEYLVFSIIEM